MTTPCFRRASQTRPRARGIACSTPQLNSVPTSKLTTHHAQQPKIFELDAGGFCCKESLRQAWLMGAQSHSRKMLAKLRLFEGKHLARLASAGKRVQQNHHLASIEVIDKVERRRTDVEQFNLRAYFVLRFETRDCLRPEAVVLQQDVADAGNQYARYRFAWNHSTFTCAIGLPSGS